MINSFHSEFCDVSYIEKDNVVLIAWKKFCRLEDYRTPTLFASALLKERSGSNLSVDARDGFEDDKEDVGWGFEVLLPGMAKSQCKVCVFILRERRQSKKKSICGCRNLRSILKYSGRFPMTRR